MKSYVKREWTGSFKEAVIVTDNVSELVALKHGIELVIKSYEESLLLYKRLLKEADNEKEIADYEKSVKEYEDYFNMLRSMAKNFETENEISIEKYSVKEEKVDYEFDFDISKLSNQEILERLRDIFPEKRLYMVPDIRGSVRKRLTVLGHGGNIVVTFK